MPGPVEIRCPVRVLQGGQDLDVPWAHAMALSNGLQGSDVSFNLKNGLETQDTGNPDEIISSPSKKKRLNGDFEGQQCYHYFIQEKFNGEYAKILELGKAFEDLTGIWLCTIGPTFWRDDTYLYLSNIRYEEERH